jgi:predicted nucleic acid-binding protein
MSGMTKSRIVLDTNAIIFLTTKGNVISSNALRRTAKHKLPDCIVAATAIVLNATLLTADEKLLRLKWQGFNVRNIM